MKNVKNVAANIKTFRKVVKINQRTLAKSCGITPTALLMIERGDRMPMLGTALRLASVMFITVDMLCEDPKDFKF